MFSLIRFSGSTIARRCRHVSHITELWRNDRFGYQLGGRRSFLGCRTEKKAVAIVFLLLIAMVGIALVRNFTDAANRAKLLERTKATTLDRMQI